MPLILPVKEKLCVHVIGAGGTGGYAIPLLARLLAGGGHVIHVWDGDVVEPKNLKRQNFCKDDLDRNKAEVMCEKVRRDVHQAPLMVAHSEYIVSPEAFLAEIVAGLEDDQSLIIAMAVDNVSTRTLINDVIMKDLVSAHVLTIVLDSGNHDQGGQVVVYGNALTRFERPFESPQMGILPTMLQMFSNLATIEDENPGLVRKCEDAAESMPQAMMANVRNGELIAQIIHRVSETHKVAGNLWTSDVLTGNTKCEFTGFLKKEG